MATVFSDTIAGQTGAATSLHKIVDLETTPVIVSSESTTLYSIRMTGNSSSTKTQLYLYNESGTVTVGTTTPWMVLSLQFSSSNIKTWTFPGGITFENGITATAGEGGGGTGAQSTPTSAVNIYFLTA